MQNKKEEDTLKQLFSKVQYYQKCSICNKEFTEGEFVYLGIDANDKLICTADCCKQNVKQIIHSFNYIKRIYTIPNDNDFLWRYLTFPKFVSMLKTQSLFFSRADKFDDPFEGAKGLAKNEVEWDSYYKNFFIHALKHSSQIPESLIERHSGVILDGFKNMCKAARLHTFINCWHKNNHESEAMWKLYCSDLKQGLAIKTTYKKLYRELNKKNDIEIGEVQYIDYTNQLVGPQAAFWSKRKSFEHEKEVRALIHNFQNFEEKEGISIPVSLNHLIDEVYVSPIASQWFVDVVDDITKRYGLDKRVRQSDLGAKPFY